MDLPQSKKKYNAKNKLTRQTPNNMACPLSESSGSDDEFEKPQSIGVSSVTTAMIQNIEVEKSQNI